MTQESAAAEQLPWERREELGGAVALLRTIGLFAMAPREAFARARSTPGFRAPLFFGIVVGTLAILLNILGAFLFGAVVVFDPPPQLDRLIEISIGGRSLEWIPLLATLVTGSILGAAMAVIVFPPIFILMLVIWSGILHVSLRTVGALRGSEAGFEATFAVAAYSSLAFLLHLVPAVGDLLATLWVIALHTIGLAVVHQTSRRRALASVLLPWIALVGGLALVTGLGPL